ncbi:DUF2797 domain-containing protein [Streptomyces sp. H27-D2]|uniref:DUF2797 domain-containing protein n=1 Tax=Streptomyces sp. H27-D2 TaxID=3046304 RepID=UPI002DB841E5|nr:DUF2797 domain-containing protein [Streptomyces sp. H27-D2]MEC4019056.1 DUF2797 domain-containing protein [Streptomyces sp. H27-D2]
MRQTEQWRCTGLRWQDGGPAWTWSHPEHGDRESPIRLGEPMALAVGPEARRRCLGVRRSGRLTPCPDSATVPAQARRDQCEVCAALDRSRSVAADTQLDDPRPYAVYLAWFGPGLCKVGITGTARGPARLLEQAAVCFTFLGRGPLMAARRAESVLGGALGIPDRVSTPAKRAARLALPGVEDRAAEVRALYEAAASVPEWTETLNPDPYELVDHAELFGLEPDPPRPTGLVTELAPGTGVGGVLRAVAGTDLYLEQGSGEGLLLLDAKLASGWVLGRAAPGEPATAPVRALEQPAAPPQTLF